MLSRKFRQDDPEETPCPARPGCQWHQALPESLKLIAEQPELMARQEMWNRAEQFTHLTYGYTPFNVHLT